MIIRRAGKGDEDYLGSVAYVMISALSSAPYWLPVTPESTIAWKKRWASRADDKAWMVWMALENDKAIGTAAFLFHHPTPLERDAEVQMLASASTLTLGTAVTRPEVRGRGIANILTWRGLEQAYKDGLDVCLVNWIGPNLLASRYWPRFGFQPAAYRLSKQVHPQISWTRAE